MDLTGVVQHGLFDKEWDFRIGLTLMAPKRDDAELSSYAEDVTQGEEQTHSDSEVEVVSEAAPVKADKAAAEKACCIG